MPVVRIPHRRIPVLLGVIAFAAGVASPARAGHVTWSAPDSITACPAGDSVLAGHPGRLSVDVTYLQYPGGVPTPRAGAPPESVWVEWTPGGGVTANDQPGIAFADDSTDAAGHTRVTVPSFSGCGTFDFTLRVAGEAVGSGSVLVRSLDADGDGAVTDADAPCDVDYDGFTGAPELGLRLDHAHHSHRNVLYGSLVPRTSLCDTCVAESPGTLGESSLSWSPDGRWIAFTIHMPPNGECAVFLVPSDPADGNAPRQFTFPDEFVHDYDPTWSPFGTEIAFGRDDNTILVKGIPGLAADTTERLVTRHLDGSYLDRGDLTPSFSPDGEWIAFGRKPMPTLHWELWKTPANGDTTRRVKLVTETNGDDMYPQWSTDGAWIAFDRLIPAGHEAVRVSSEGGAIVPMLVPGSGIRASLPSFAPDGAVFLAGVGPTFPGASTRTVDAELSNLPLPTDSAVVAYPAYLVPGGFPVLSPRMSPDGTRITLRTRQLYAARRNMSRPPKITTVAGYTIPPATPYVDLHAFAGLPLQFTVGVTDPEGDPVTVAAYFLKEAMTFDANTNTFAWSAPDSFVGRTVVVRFQATTPSGGSAYALARIGVNPSAAAAGEGAPAGFGRVSPNPFAAGVKIPFAFDGAREVGAEIFDVAGRRVRVLARARAETGSGVLVWDGSDEAGRAAPPGLYLCRASAGAERAEIRLVKLPGGAR